MAQHSKEPQRSYALKLHNQSDNPTGWHREVVSRGTAFTVALEHFHDAQPGEHIADQTYRFHSPTWGWVYVTVGERL